MSTRIGVDIGGTFTDLVFYDDATGDVRVGKTLTTPGQLEQGVLDVVGETLSAEQIGQAEHFLHGTTAGLNLLLTGSGASTGLLCTDGFRDVLEIRHAETGVIYDLFWKPPAPLSPRRWRLPIRERTRADGEVLTPLEARDVQKAARTFDEAGVEAVAVCFLNSYINPAHELEAERLLKEHGFAGNISLSHRLSGELREYQRTSTAVIDAYIRRDTGRYARSLDEGLKRQGFAGQFAVMRSGGGTMPGEELATRPVEAIQSGPVAGAEGGAEIARALGWPVAVTADVGGTSFDTALILDGQPIVKHEGEIEGWPVQTQWVDVHSIGSGGGSIAYLDAGRLRVGPRSAGAAPGPACYGRGGSEPTVTDAALLLGMFGDGLLSEGLRLDAELARTAMEPVAADLSVSVEEAAQAVLKIATVAQAEAIREITIGQGEDPREAWLVLFGGAGPLFGPLLADELSVKGVAVPPHAGNFSAWGLLGQAVTRDVSRTLIRRLDDALLVEIDNQLDGMYDKIGGGSANDQETEHHAGLDLRYVGQDHTLTVWVPARGRRLDTGADAVRELFEQQYERRYGTTLEEGLEVATLRAMTRTPLPRRAQEHVFSDEQPDVDRPATTPAFSFAEAEWTDFAVLQRSDIETGATVSGPAIVFEPTATTYVDVGFSVEADPTAGLLMTRSKPSSGQADEHSGAARVGGEAADAVTTEVIRYALLSAAGQIRRVLMRTAFSQIIYEIVDFAAGLFDRDGRLLAQAPSLAAFLGTLDLCTKAAVEAVGGSESLAEGDILVYNIPYGTGSHPQDVAVVMPAFADGELVGFAGIKSHWVDIAGKDPYCADTQDTFQEGTIFPGVKLYEGGVRNDALWRMILANCRVPTWLAGDVNANIGGVRTGTAALGAIVEKYGREAFDSAVDRMFAASEQGVRAFLEAIPDGRYVAQRMIDNDGLDLDNSLSFEVAYEIEGSDMTVDLTGFPPQQPGPVNTPLPGAISAGRLGLAALTGVARESPDDGMFRPIHFKSTPGTVAHPVRPAPCFNFMIAQYHVFDGMYRALAHVVPEKVTAMVGGDPIACVFWGDERLPFQLLEDVDEPWIESQAMPMGMGGNIRGDGGNSLFHLLDGGSRVASIEVFEARIPWMLDTYELRVDSPGPGRTRGGLGLNIFCRPLVDSWVTSIIEHTKSPASGLFGGGEGTNCRVFVVHADGTETDHPRAAALPLAANCGFNFQSGGGGGYGPPEERPVQEVADDLIDGYHTLDYVRTHYPAQLAAIEADGLLPSWSRLA
jgi:N-methylhydantoinase A